MSLPEPFSAEANSVEEDEAEGGGGGSMTEEAGDGFERGSGSGGIASSADEVSIVMFRVAGADWRSA